MVVRRQGDEPKHGGAHQKEGECSGFEGPLVLFLGPGRKCPDTQPLQTLEPLSKVTLSPIPSQQQDQDQSVQQE